MPRTTYAGTGLRHYICICLESGASTFAYNLHASRSLWLDRFKADDEAAHVPLQLLYFKALHCDDLRHIVVPAAALAACSSHCWRCNVLQTNAKMSHGGKGATRISSEIE